MDWLFIGGLVVIVLIQVGGAYAVMGALSVPMAALGDLTKAEEEDGGQ